MPSSLDSQSYSCLKVATRSPSTRYRLLTSVNVILPVASGPSPTTVVALVITVLLQNVTEAFTRRRVILSPSARTFDY